MNDPNFLARMTGYGVDNAVYEARESEREARERERDVKLITKNH